MQSTSHFVLAACAILLSATPVHGMGVRTVEVSPAGAPGGNPVVTEVPSWPAGSAQEATITVSGVGTVEVAPDIATLRIGVETTAQSTSVALEENRRAISTMTASLIGLGVAEDDLQTASYHIGVDRPGLDLPEAVRSAATPTIRVTNLVAVRIRDLTRTGDIIDAAVAAGANQMWGLEFGVSNRNAVQRDAIAQAVADARDRAAFLASLAGLSLGPILRIRQVVAPDTGIAAVRSEGLGSASNVTPGRMVVSAGVEVVFALVAEDGHP